MKENRLGLPPKQGLYDPQFEKDACGMGFVANIKGMKSHTIIRQALTVLENMEHRGGQGSEPNTGDGAGIMLQIPHAFFARELKEHGIELPAMGNTRVGMLFLSQDESCAASMSASWRQSFVRKARRLSAGVRFRPMTRISAHLQLRLSRLFVRYLLEERFASG